MKEQVAAPMTLKELESKYPKIEIRKGKWRYYLMMAGEELEKHGMDYEPPKNANILLKAGILFWQKLFQTGDIVWFKELADRMDGKAPQAVHIGDADGEKLSVSIIRFSDLPLAGESSTVAYHPPKRLDS